MAYTPALETQEKLSKKTGIGQATLSRTLNAATWPNAKLIEKVAKAFRVEPWQLLVPGFQPRSTATDAEIPPNERRCEACWIGGRSRRGAKVFMLPSSRSDSLCGIAERPRRG